MKKPIGVLVLAVSAVLVPLVSCGQGTTPGLIPNSTVVGNFSGGTAISSAQNVPSCANDGSHSLTNNGGSGLNCTAISGTTASVSSVSNSDGSLTITPTTGAVVASINLGHTNIFTVTETVPILNIVAGRANGINDQSTVAASQANFWPTVGPAVVHRMNRLAVGEASTSSLSPGGNTWVDAITGNFSVLANITSIGSLFSGINAAGRTSDTVNSGIGTPSGGSAGGYLLGYNDDATQGNIAVGSSSIGVAATGTKGIVIGAQQDVDTAAVPGCVTNPSQTLCATGSTAIGLLVTPGAYSGVATQNPNAAIVMQLGGASGKVFTKGIMFASGVLDGAQGNGGRGVAMELMPGQTIRWFDGTTNFAEMGTVSGGTFGLNTNSSQWSINGVSTVSCSGSPTASFQVTNGIVTHC